MRENDPVKRLGLVLGLLLCAAGSAAFASRMWDWVLNFDPGFEFDATPVPTGPPSTAGVTILLVDGLRLDASRGMPTLNALRGRGADVEAQVGTPSFSRPGRATVAVGAPPGIHGVTTNRQKRSVPLDNIIRGVGAHGGRCRVAGSKIWSSLFGRDIEGCGAYREGEGKEGPGAFARQVGEVRASQEAGVAFVLQEKSMLRIADVISTDFAAHEYGGTSAEYRAEVQRADALLADLVKGLDLSQETLVVTADHGHRDGGGHGGEEPEVLAIPLVMVGAGIRPGTTATASQADIAPTVAALLGLPLPAASSGRPIESALMLEESRRGFLKEAAAAHRVAFERAVGARLGVVAGPGGPSNWPALIQARRAAETEGRSPIAALAIILLLAFALAAILFSGAGWIGLLGGASAATVVLLGPIGARIPIMSFSAINYDEMLVPFFVRVMTLSAITTFVASACGVITGRLPMRRSVADSPFALVGSIGLLGSAVLGVAVIRSWLGLDLLSPLTLPGPDQLVQAFSLTLGMLSASVATLIMLAVIGGIEAIRRS
jgi:hypothetical protein